MSARSELRLIRPHERSADTQQTGGMTREAAIASARLWSGIVRAAPGMSSGWHHHGEYETSIYVIKGRARFEFGVGGASAVEARQGDFVHVPPGAVHRESNPESEEAVFAITRAGSGVPVVNVEGPA